MPNPRFISIDTAVLNDGDVLVYDVQSHSLKGQALDALSLINPAEGVLAVIVTGDATVTASQAQARFLSLRGTPAANFTYTLPAVPFAVTIRNETTKTATITRQGGSVSELLAPSESADFYCIP